ncbi:Tn3 family transposase, partial [Escherichia coli]|nr:Tn3 family transposase [Escherichia coli]
SPGLTYAKLSWLQAWHIRDETYSAALAELVNHQYRHAFAAHWDDILRLASSIKQGTVTASLMLRKLGSYPRQNGLAVALRE